MKKQIRPAVLLAAAVTAITAMTTAVTPTGALARGTTGPNGPKPRSATFEVRHELAVMVPDGAKKMRVWFTMPQDDPAQKVKGFKIDCPFPTRIETDSEGNRSVFLELAEPKVKDFSIVETFTLTRREVRSGVDAARTRPISEADRAAHAKDLEANTNVVINEEVRRIAAEAVGTEKNPVVAARRLYDWVLGNVDYWVKDPNNKKASPVGSTTYCLANRTGNCTDFHSLWTSLARSSGIPTRMVYGSFFKSELNGQDKDQSYHCWPEFWAPKIGWVPHDVAVADIFVGDFETNKDNEEKVRLTTGDGYHGPDKTKVDYYFGNIDERRVVWSRGRDLILSPRQDGGPVNALAKAYVEVDGQVGTEKTVWTRKLTYREEK